MKNIFEGMLEAYTIYRACKNRAQFLKDFEGFLVANSIHECDPDKYWGVKARALTQKWKIRVEKPGLPKRVRREVEAPAKPKKVEAKKEKK